MKVGIYTNKINLLVCMFEFIEFKNKVGNGQNIENISLMALFGNLQSISEMFFFLLSIKYWP